HLHAAAQLIAGTKLGIPTIVLIREPAESVASEAIRSYPVPLRSVLHAYCCFYEALRPYLDCMTVGEFRTVTSDFGSVIQAVNCRFGTSFGLFEHRPEKMSTVFKLIEEREKRPDIKFVDEYLAGRKTLDEVCGAFRELERRGVPAMLHEHKVPRPS